jgi:hypothetical protein
MRTLRIFPLLALAQLGLAIFAIVAGVKFLKLQAWARTALEGLTWFFLAFIVAFKEAMTGSADPSPPAYLEGRDGGPSGSVEA